MSRASLLFRSIGPRSINSQSIQSQSIKACAIAAMLFLAWASPGAPAQSTWGEGSSGAKPDEPRQPQAKAPPKHLDRMLVEFAPGVTAEFVYIDAPAVAPDGFLIGSPDTEPARGEDEGRFRAVLTRAYWIQTTEITQRQWEAVTDISVRQIRDAIEPDRPLFGEGPDYPMYWVSYDDAMVFVDVVRARGVAARLPTEAEWEFACRAGTTTPFANGTRLSARQANFNATAPAETDVYTVAQGAINRAATTTVASFAPNAWGLHDMHGNVWEWCADGYLRERPQGTVRDPMTPPREDLGVARGGSWNSPVDRVRSAARFVMLRQMRLPTFGFRLVIEAHNNDR